MATLQADVFLGEEHALVKVGIEIGLHQRVSEVLGPAHEVVHALLRTVGIIDLQTIAQGLHVVAHGTQAVGSHTGEQGRRLLVAVDATAHEIVGAEIAYLEDGIGHHIGEGHKLAVVVGRADLGPWLARGEARHEGRAAEDEDGG